MSAKTILAAVLLIGLALAFVWERGALAEFRQQNESCRAEREEADRLAVENRELRDLRAVETRTTGPRSERGELLRLRNEVRPLRAQKREVEKLRAENQRLADEIKSGNFAPRKLSEMEGYVAKETWSNAGFATPEATVRTFIWAFSSGNLEQFVQCLPPEDALRLQRHLKGDPEGFRKELFDDANPFRKLNGFRIAERTPVDENNVQLGIQAAAGGEILPLRLRRFGQEWKIEDF
jgi:cell division protein FtsB